MRLAHAWMANQWLAAVQALLMQVPFVGPLAYVPMQFAAAWLLDLLLRRQPARNDFAAPNPVSAFLPSHGHFLHDSSMTSKENTGQPGVMDCSSTS